MAADTGHKVDGVAPAVVGAPALVSAPSAGDTYGRGEAIDVALTFSEPVTVNGAPRLGVLVGAETRPATYRRRHRDGDADLPLHSVVAADADADGVSIPAGEVALAGGAITDLPGNAAALAYTELAAQAGHKVNANTAPVVTGVELASVAGPDDTYAAGDTVEVRLTFDAAVTVDVTQGKPRLKLDLDDIAGSGERWAEYASGTGTTELVFAYTVVSGDTSAEGVAVLANTLELNGGTMRSAAGTGAALAHAAVAASASHRVDTAPPALSDASVEGDTLTLTFAEALLDTAGEEPVGSAFTVKVDTSEVALVDTDSVAVAGAAVTLTLAQAVSAGRAVTVSYSPPADQPIRDLAGNAAAGFTDEAVTNASPRPMLSRARVTGDTLVLSWDRALDAASKPAAGDFTVTVADADRGVSRVAVKGPRVILTLASAVSAGETVTVSYRPGVNPIRDEAGSAAAELSGQPVTHNGAPTYGGPDESHD